MYGKLHERKLRQTDYVFSCEEARKELDQYIDAENRRVNIDSAKKMAVLQHMDYEGFRQMVLGANIFPTKSKQMISLTKPQEGTNPNPPNKVFDSKKERQQSLIPEQIQIRGNSELYCFSFRDFKKKFMLAYQKQLTNDRAEECYKLLKEQNQSRLQRIFNLDCEVGILVKIVDVFQFVQKYLSSGEEEEIEIETGFMVSFLQTILSFENMQEMNLAILTKKERNKLLSFLENSNRAIPQSVLKVLRK